MGTTIANLNVVLAANVGKFVSEFDKANAAFTKQAKSWNSFAGDLSSAGTTLSVVTAPLVAIGAAAAYAGTQVESAMATIRAGTGATGESLAALGESFETVARNVPNDFAAVGTAIADVNTRTGLTGPALEGLATQFLNLARVAGIDVAQGIATGTRVLGDWGIANADAESAMDNLWKVAQSTGIGFTDLSTQLVMFGGPLRQMGFDFETSAALLGKFEKEGVNAELVMGSLRIGLARMAKEGITDSRAALEALTQQIQATESPTKRVQLAMEVFGAKAGPDMAAAIFEGRFAVDDLMKSIDGSEETINKAAADTLKFADQWGIVKNNLLLAIEPLGTKLLGALDSVMPQIVAMANALGSVVEWFAGLPTPILAAVAGVAAFAVAIGPVLVGVGSLISAITAIGGVLAPLAGALGVSIAALSGWAVAIAAAGAALIAFGVWVYDNWESIKASLLQAWDGLTEMWGAAWGGALSLLQGVWTWLDENTFGALSAIATFVGMIWDEMVRQWTGAWNLITTGLSAIWDALATSAAFVWNGIVDVIKGALSWMAANIPGMDKILTLDKAWEGAKNVTAAHKELTAEIKTTSTATDKLAGSLGNGSNGLIGSSKKAEAAAKKLREEQEKLWLITDKNENMVSRLEKQLALVAKTADREAKKAFEDTTDEAKALNEKLLEMYNKSSDLSKIALPDVVEALGELKAPIDAGWDAMDRFGLKSEAELQKVVDEAQRAYDELIQSGKATQFQQDSAYLQVMEAMAEKSKALSGQIPADMQKALSELNAKVNGADGLKKAKGSFEAFGGEVSTIITNLAQDMAKSLFDGDLSWGEKLKSALVGLGEAAVSTFITPFATALSGMINGVLKDFISGDFSLKSIVDNIKGIGSAVSEVFGSGSSVSVGGGGGGGGLGGGGGGGVSPGGADPLSVVTGIAQLASSVWGNFQNLEIETSLDDIESHTRWLKRGLVELPNNVVETNRSIRDWLWLISSQIEHVVEEVDGVWQLPNLLATESGARISQFLQRIDDSTRASVTQQRAIATATTSAATFFEQLRTGGGSIVLNLTVNANGSTTTTTQTLTLNQNVAYNMAL